MPYQGNLVTKSRSILTDIAIISEYLGVPRNTAADIRTIYGYPSTRKPLVAFIEDLLLISQLSRKATTLKEKFALYVAKDGVLLNGTPVERASKAKSHYLRIYDILQKFKSSQKFD